MNHLWLIFVINDNKTWLWRSRYWLRLLLLQNGAVIIKLILIKRFISYWNKVFWWLLLKFHIVLNLEAIGILYTLSFDIGSQMSNSMFVFGSLFSNKFHIANMVSVNDLRLSSFFATLTAVPIYWQQYKDFSSNVSLACDKTDNKDQFSLGTDWPTVALKDTKCALHVS